MSYRSRLWKKGLTKELFNEADYSNFDQVNADKNKFIADDGSMFIPSLNVDSPADFFTTKEFTDQNRSFKKNLTLFFAILLLGDYLLTLKS